MRPSRKATERQAGGTPRPCSCRGCPRKGPSPRSRIRQGQKEKDALPEGKEICRGLCRQGLEKRAHPLAEHRPGRRHERRPGDGRSALRHPGGRNLRDPGKDQNHACRNGEKIRMRNLSEKVVILSAVRTPIGKFGGVFKDTSAVFLGVAASVEAMKRAGVTPDQIAEAIFGMARQAGNRPNPARQILYRSRSEE